MSKFLPILAHAYRTTINSVTGFTPFFANHARQPSEFVKLNFTSGTTLDDYVHKLQKAMMNCWKSASQRRIEKHNRADEAKLHKNTRHPKQPNSDKSTMLPFHSKIQNSKKSQEKIIIQTKKQSNTC